MSGGGEEQTPEVEEAEIALVAGEDEVGVKGMAEVAMRADEDEVGMEMVVVGAWEEEVGVKMVEVPMMMRVCGRKSRPRHGRGRGTR